MKKLIIIFLLMVCFSAQAAQLGAIKTYYIMYRGQMLRTRTRNIAHQKIMKAHKAKHAKRDKDGKRINTKTTKWTDANGISHGRTADWAHITKLPVWTMDVNDINGVSPALEAGAL